MYSDYSQVIPDCFTAKEKFLSFRMNLKIKTPNGQTIGKILQQFSFSRSFKYFDKNENLICSAKEKLWSWGVHLEIFGADGQKIGSIDKQHLKSFLSFKDKYFVKDAQGNIIGQSEQFQFFNTDVELFDHQRKKIGHMKKLFMNFRDTWECQIYGNIDRRLLIFIPAFISANQTS